jgi:hypothetical protein
MNPFQLAGRILVSTLLFSATASAYQDHTLSNGTIDLKFKQSGRNLWLTSIESLGGQTIALEQGLPLWVVEARLDPSDPSMAQHDLDIVPANLPLSIQQAATGGAVMLSATWGPAVVAPPAGSPSAGPRVRVIATWTLKNGDDTASTTISVSILNPAQSSYRLWLTRYPRVAVGCLDANLDGSDRLALGRNGGLLYGDPIHYTDPEAGPLRLTRDPDHEVLLISPDSLEPGTLGIPASTYYDSTSGLGLYHATDDDDGYVKGIYWTQEPELGPNGSLLLQTIQYATGNIYEATSYSSPYKVQLAALDRGDWIGAAQRYRTTWRGFAAYPGPVGSASNELVSPELKDVPIALWHSSGNGYCVVGPNGTFDPIQAQADLDDLTAFMGTPFPFVYLNRYPVDVPHEIFLSGYVQAPNMQPVRTFIDDAEQAGHKTVIHTMTEKSFVTSSDHVNCDYPFDLCSFCDFDDPDLMDMYVENALVKKPGGPTVSAPCPRGAGTTSGVDWPGWFVALNADFSNDLHSTGGLGWTAPNPTSGWCFAETHAHEPGFGSFHAQGWLEMLQDTAAGVTTTNTFARTMETSVAFFSQAAGVQNTWNFDLGRDLGHFEGTPGDLSSYYVWENAPIWRIPMMQMAIDNARYASVYSPATLSYPYDPAYSTSFPIFDEFPAVTGALACWSMAERVLSYQSVVYLNNYMMVPVLDVSSPGTDEVKNAAADMYKYYRGLVSFLMGSAPASLGDYHTGSLERPPAVTLDGVSQTFVLTASTITAEFDAFETLLGLFNVPVQDIDWSKYQPFKHLVGQNDGLTTVWLPAAPGADPTYLPNGMYRHHDGQSLAFLLTNPWGVKHLDCSSPPCVSTPLNPFTFDYGTPAASPSNTYDYRFTFEPSDYRGFPTSYDVAMAVYDVDGQVVSQTSFQPASGATEFTGTLAPHQYAAWVFQP